MPSEEPGRLEADGVRGSALELVAVEEVERLLAANETEAWSASELAYARSKPDPARRLAARLAAKRAASRLLGADLPLGELEVVRGGFGPPSMRLSARARERAEALGASRVLVSLTHERRDAAALVLLVEDA